MTRSEKHESKHAANHPRRTLGQSRELADAGWFPFPELTEEENDIIFQARLAGMASCFPAYPTAEKQAQATLLGAKTYLMLQR